MLTILLSLSVFHFFLYVSLRENNSKTQLAVFHQCDITDWRSQEALYKVSTETFEQSVDVVIIIAGILDSSNLVSDTEQGNQKKPPLFFIFI